MEGKLYKKIEKLNFINNRIGFKTSSGNQYKIFELKEKNEKYYLIEVFNVRRDITLSLFQQDSKLYDYDKVEEIILEDMKDVC